MKNKIICPHCKHEYSDDDMMKSQNDLWYICPNEEGVVEYCVKCDEEFYIQGGYVPVYDIYEYPEDYYDTH